MSRELTADSSADGWTIAMLEYSNDTSCFIVRVKGGEIDRVLGTGTRQEAEVCAAALNAMHKVNLTPGDPAAQGIILKGLKTTLELARQYVRNTDSAADSFSDPCTALYAYDLDVTAAFIVGMEKRNTPDEARPIKVPSNLS